MTPAALVEWLAEAPQRAGLCLDFDGTLAPIQEDPGAVRLAGEVRPLLGGLAARLAVVAIVSGRPAAFLGDRVEVPGVRLLGLYGLEEWRDGAAHARPEARRWQPAVADAREALRAQLGEEPGVLIEDKGLSVAVHWRRAPDRAAAERRVTEAVAALARDTGLAREPGKLVDELRPPVEWDKGAAVRAVAGDADRLVYAGDDRGDLAAFAAVRELGGRAVAVDHGEETPAELRAQADVVVDGQGGMTGLLARLHARLS